MATDVSQSGNCAISNETNGHSSQNGTSNPGEHSDTSQIPSGEQDRKDGQLFYPTGKTVYVLNLPPHMIFSYVEELTNIFSKYGEIKCVKRGGITVNGLSADLTISAYVHFTNIESSEKALNENGTVIGGNPIAVHILRAGPHSVKVDNLPVQVGTECLKNLLLPCGAIKEISKIPARRIAFIEFEDEEGLNKALSLNGKLMVNSVKLSIEKNGAETKKLSAKLKPKNLEKNTQVLNTKGNGAGSWGGSWQGNGRSLYRARGAISNHGGQWSARGGARVFRGGGNAGNGGTSYNGSLNNYWNNDNFKGNFDANRQMKRRKQTNWIRQY